MHPQLSRGAWNNNLNNDICVTYLDDILVYSETFQDHLSRLRQVLQRIQQYGMKLKAAKCRLFKRKVNDLGRVISAEGHLVNPSETKALEALKEANPSTVGDVRKLMGFIGYYRMYTSKIFHDWLSHCMICCHLKT